jgi:hypothetical protein
LRFIFTKLTGIFSDSVSPDSLSISERVLCYLAYFFQCRIDHTSYYPLSLPFLQSPKSCHSTSQHKSVDLTPWAIRLASIYKPISLKLFSLLYTVQHDWLYAALVFLPNHIATSASLDKNMLVKYKITSISVHRKKKFTVDYIIID